MNLYEFNETFLLRFSMEMVCFLLLLFIGSLIPEVRRFKPHWGLFVGLFGFGPGFFFLVALCCTSYEISDGLVMSSNNARNNMVLRILWYYRKRMLNKCSSCIDKCRSQFIFLNYGTYTFQWNVEITLPNGSIGIPPSIHAVFINWAFDIITFFIHYSPKVLFQIGAKLNNSIEQYWR